MSAELFDLMLVLGLVGQGKFGIPDSAEYYENSEAQLQSELLELSLERVLDPGNNIGSPHPAHLRATCLQNQSCLDHFSPEDLAFCRDQVLKNPLGK